MTPTEPLTSGDPPLTGIRVIEMGSFIAGPFCSMLLGDLGAEVIKLELPGEGDPMRLWGKPSPLERHSYWWSVIGRNKKSVTLNLKDPRGRELARDLIRTSDVLVENFRPGTLERWGFEYEQLRQENPRLVMVRISGFGQTGPYKDRAGFGTVAEAMGGLRYLAGYPDRPPVRFGISIADSLAGLIAALGAVSALYTRRDRDGLGQVVDVGLTDAVLAVMENIVVEHSALGVVRERTGSTLPGVAPSSIYPTSDGEWIIIGANADTVFRRLAEAMKRPELAEDPSFATHSARGERQADLDQIIQEWTSRHTLEQLLERLHEAGVPAGPVNTAREVCRDPHFRERGAVVDVEDPRLGQLTMQAAFPFLSRTPPSIRWPGPALGEQTEEVLEGLLGLRRQQIDALREAGVI